MEIRVIMLTGCLLISLLTACGEEPDLPDDPVEVEEEYPDIEYNYHIDGYRSELVDVLGKALGKPTGEEITKEELATLTHITIPYITRGHHQMPIALGYDDMALLVHCVNLQALTSSTRILDLSPLVALNNLTELNISSPFTFDLRLELGHLSNLTNLTKLDLSSGGAFDLSPLANLINLTELSLYGGGPLDLNPLAGLINLTELDLSDNKLFDIQPLAELTNLQHLNLRGNNISDITSLSGLIQLQRIDLSDNQIVNLKPLVDNPGFANENPAHRVVVVVLNNPLSDVSRNVYIPTLEARGVSVKH